MLFFPLGLGSKLMATANNRSSSNTKQITMAAFKRYVATKEESTVCSDNGSDTNSPLGSPSAITPTPLDHDFTEEDLWERPAPPQARSRNEESRRATAEQVRVFENLALQLGHSVHSNDTNTENERVTNIVVRRLRIIGDEFDQTLSSRTWTTIARAFRSQDGTILRQFSQTIISVKKELSLHMVVKIFYFGWRMITSLSPTDYYTEQQYRIVSVFADFLLSELSDWIENQGGWESIIIDDHLRSHSTSDIPDHQTIPPQPLQAPDPNLSRLSSTESNNADQTPPQSMRSYSHSYSEASTRPSSSSVPIPRQRPRPLTLQLSSPQTHSRRIEPRNGSESPSSLPSSGSFGSVVSFGLGVSFGIALCSFFFSK